MAMLTEADVKQVLLDRQLGLARNGTPIGHSNPWQVR